MSRCWLLALLEIKHCDEHHRARIDSVSHEPCSAQRIPDEMSLEVLEALKSLFFVLAHIEQFVELGDRKDFVNVSANAA